MMGLFGIIIASIVNMFMQSTMMYYVISILGVLIFVGLTAYDTQKIKNMYLVSDSGEIMGKKAVMGAQKDKAFQSKLQHLLTTYVGRPTPLTFAERLSSYCGGAKIYLKREDLAHSGAHKINNALGQALLAKRMGKSSISLAWQAHQTIWT